MHTRVWFDQNPKKPWKELSAVEFWLSQAFLTRATAVNFDDVWLRMSGKFNWLYDCSGLIASNAVTSSAWQYIHARLENNNFCQTNATYYKNWPYVPYLPQPRDSNRIGGDRLSAVFEWTFKPVLLPPSLQLRREPRTMLCAMSPNFDFGSGTCWAYN